jgi:hypothetical protein
MSNLEGSTIITHAEFITMISRGLGIISKVQGALFDDVAVDSKFAGDIALAKELVIKPLFLFMLKLPLLC